MLLRPRAIIAQVSFPQSQDQSKATVGSKQTAGKQSSSSPPPKNVPIPTHPSNPTLHRKPHQDPNTTTASKSPKPKSYDPSRTKLAKALVRCNMARGTPVKTACYCTPLYTTLNSTMAQGIRGQGTGECEREIDKTSTPQVSG